MPDVAGLGFLLWVFVLVPRMAFRSRARWRDAAHTVARGGAGDARASAVASPSRVRVLATTSGFLLFLLLLSVAVGGTFGFQVFTYRSMPWQGWLLGAAALAGCLVVRAVLRATEPPSVRAARAAWRPVTSRERWFFVLTAVLAGVAEEAAYRGTGWQLLGWVLGDRLVMAMGLLVAAFALAHAAQGWRAMVAVGVMAIVMHLLVWQTETLVVAMAVHVAYDLLSGLWLGAPGVVGWGEPGLAGRTGVATLMERLGSSVGRAAD